MATCSSLTGLKRLQRFFRAIQLFVCLIVVGIFSYYLATLFKNHLEVRTGIMVVEVIALIGTLYAITGMLPVCFTGNRTLSLVSPILDLAFAICFMYVAVENRSASGGCATEIVYTVYGSGAPTSGPGTENGLQPAGPLPTFQAACRLMMICLVASCLVIPFFILSGILGFYLNRKRSQTSQHVQSNINDEFGTKPYRPSLGSVGSGNTHPSSYQDALSTHAHSGNAQTQQADVPPPRYSEGDIEDRVHGLDPNKKHGSHPHEDGQAKKRPY